MCRTRCYCETASCSAVVGDRYLHVSTCISTMHTYARDLPFLQALPALAATPVAAANGTKALPAKFPTFPIRPSALPCSAVDLVHRRVVA